MALERKILEGKSREVDPGREIRVEIIVQRKIWGGESRSRDIIGEIKEETCRKVYLGRDAICPPSRNDDRCNILLRKTKI